MSLSTVTCARPSGAHRVLFRSELSARTACGPTMRRLGSVQRKMPCVFVTEVKEEPSAKREHQVPRSAGPAGLCLNPVWAPRRVGAALRTGLGAFLQLSVGTRGWGSPGPRGPGSCTFLVVREETCGGVFIIGRFTLAIAWKLTSPVLNYVPLISGCHLLRTAP